jgi:hypothetical protein
MSTIMIDKKPHVHKALIQQWSDAPWAWDVFAHDGAFLVGAPAWTASTKYVLRPSKQHPSYHIWLEWRSNQGWWKLYVWGKLEGPKAKREVCGNPNWHIGLEYGLEKSDKHPDNVKPKKQLIDWRKMPVGTATNQGNICSVALEGVYTIYCGRPVLFSDSELRLRPDSDFTYWGGGACPAPEGVIVKCIFRGGQTSLHLTSADTLRWAHSGGADDIIAYRMVGLCEGYTDNPAEA